MLEMLLVVELIKGRRNSLVGHARPHNILLNTLVSCSLSRQIPVVSQAGHQTLSQMFLLVRKVVIIHAPGAPRMHQEPILAVGKSVETPNTTAVHEELPARMCMPVVSQVTSRMPLKTRSIVATSIRIYTHTVADLD